MRLPDLVAYQAAVQHPSTAFADPQLRSASVTTGNFGLPRAVAGNFAVTYQLRAGAHQWAVRCFHREAADRAARYAAISQSLARLPAGPLVPIEYLDAGVRVGQTWYPITKMPWLEGRPLNRAVEERLSTPSALLDIERRFVSTVAELRRLGIAHGDLQHGNVLVDSSGRLRLVDYDGMFVPALHGRPASETGDPNYQHPRRQLQFDAELDRFASIVIVLALRALAVAPQLWQTYTTGDNLLFRRTDFVNPSASPVFRDLAGLSAVRELSARFADICQTDYARVPTLDEYLNAGRPTLSPRHAAVLNSLYAPAPRQPRVATNPWTLRRASLAVLNTLYTPGPRTRSNPQPPARTTPPPGTRGSPTSPASNLARTLPPPGRPRSPTPRSRAVLSPGAQIARGRTPRAARTALPPGAPVTRHRPQGAAAPARRALTPAGAPLTSGDQANTPRSWKLRRSSIQTSLALSPDGHSIASGDRQGRITLRDAATGRTLRTLRLPRSAGAPRALAFTPAGDLLALAVDGRRLGIWDVRLQRERQVFCISGRTLRSVALSSNGAWLAAASDDGGLQCWKVASGRPLSTDVPHASVTALAVARNGRCIAAAGPRLGLTVWDARGGEPLAHLPIGRGVTRLAFGGDGSHLAVASPGGGASVWSLGRGGPGLTDELPAALGQIETLALSADAETLAATTAEGAILVR
ncbi:MAG: hypothetical protein JO057_05795, partial [Chloroflexi bacterium]|nr:hypothetical protein [Chloroflexota bacterium]